MKLLILFLVMVLLFNGCVKEKNLYVPDEPRWTITGINVNQSKIIYSFDENWNLINATIDKNKYTITEDQNFWYFERVTQ